MNHLAGLIGAGGKISGNVIEAGSEEPSRALFFRNPRDPKAGNVIVHSTSSPTAFRFDPLKFLKPIPDDVSTLSVGKYSRNSEKIIWETFLRITDLWCHPDSLDRSSAGALFMWGGVTTSGSIAYTDEGKPARLILEGNLRLVAEAFKAGAVWVRAKIASTRPTPSKAIHIPVSSLETCVQAESQLPKIDLTTTAITQPSRRRRPPPTTGNQTRFLL